MKKLLSGNEALARGALEARIEIACGYPGTPSSEILENVSKYKEIYSEWSVNEKVAMDAAAGAAYSGRRALVTTKQVGMNVAERAKAKGIENVVFDRGGYLYHGRVQALAEGAREGGLKF